MKNTHQHREIRVFLSSTFKDMEKERNYLITKVFPIVREACSQRSVVFTEIDLRWGVTEEESSNGEAIEICLNQIDRCRHYPPFFIGFLGERYGWVPTDDELKNYLKVQKNSGYRQHVEKAIESKISVTELEMEYGILSSSDEDLHALIYLRDQELTNKLCSGASERQNIYYDNAEDKLNQLKNRLKALRNVSVNHYNSIEQFGESIKHKLLSWLDTQFPEDSNPLPYENTLLSQQNFARSRLNGYVPLIEKIEEVEKHIESTLACHNSIPTSVYGQSGTGKSSFVGYLATHLSQKYPKAIVIPYFVGADGNRTLESWRDFLIEYLNYTVLGEPLSSKIERFDWDVLNDRIARVADKTQHKVILLLDAIDQCDASYKALSFLEHAFSTRNAVLILSSTFERLHFNENWHLVEMPMMDTQLRSQLIQSHSNSFRKKLSKNQIERLIQDQSTELPLYTKLVLEDLRLNSSFESLNIDIENNLKNQTASQLFGHILTKLDGIFSTDKHPEIVSILVQMIAASRRGLCEHDLSFLLANQSDPISECSNRHKLAGKHLYPILSILRPYILRDQGRERLMHAVMNDVVLTSKNIVNIRRDLVKYHNGTDANCVVERLHQMNALIDMGQFKKHNAVDIFGNDILHIENLLTCYQTDLSLFNQIMIKIDYKKDGDTNTAKIFAYQARLKKKNIDLEHLFNMFEHLNLNGYTWLAHQLLIKCDLIFRNRYHCEREAFNFITRKSTFELKAKLPFAENSEFNNLQVQHKYTNHQEIGELLKIKDELLQKEFELSNLYLSIAYSNILSGEYEHALYFSSLAFSENYLNVNQRENPKSKLIEIDALLALATCLKHYACTGSKPERLMIPYNLMDFKLLLNGDYATKADNILKLVVDKITQYEGANSASLIKPLLHLAELYDHLNQPELAQVCYQKCIKIAFSTPTPGAHWMIPLTESFLNFGKKQQCFEQCKNQISTVFNKWRNTVPLTHSTMFTLNQILHNSDNRMYYVSRSAPSLEFIKMQHSVAAHFHQLYASEGPEKFGLLFWDYRTHFGHAHVGLNLYGKIYFIYVRNPLFSVGNEAEFIKFCRSANAIPCYVNMKDEHALAPNEPVNVSVINALTKQPLVIDRTIDGQMPMSQWDYYDIAVQAVRQDIERSGFQVLSHSIDPKLFPSICFIKDNKMCSVHVTGQPYSNELTSIKSTFSVSQDPNSSFYADYKVNVVLFNPDDKNMPLYRGSAIGSHYTSIFSGSKSIQNNEE